MKETIIDAGVSLLTRNNDFKTHTKSNYYNEVNDCLNQLEEMVCGIISESYCFFDETPKNKNEIQKKFDDIQNRYNEFVYYKNTHKTKISERMFEILSDIEIELFKEKQTINSLFFIKSDILDNLEHEFVQQLIKDRKKIERGKKL